MPRISARVLRLAQQNTLACHVGRLDHLPPKKDSLFAVRGTEPDAAASRQSVEYYDIVGKNIYLEQAH